jgi:hypothetical protein
MAGLAEIYLEAARVLESEVWLTRAQEIAELICHLAIPNSTGGVSWIVEHPELPTADLMVGASGVLHLLARVSHSGMGTSFPLLVPC